MKTLGYDEPQNLFLVAAPEQTSAQTPDLEHRLLLTDAKGQPVNLFDMRGYTSYNRKEVVANVTGKTAEGMVVREEDDKSLIGESERHRYTLSNTYMHLVIVVVAADQCVGPHKNPKALQQFISCCATLKSLRRNPSLPPFPSQLLP